MFRHLSLLFVLLAPLSASGDDFDLDAQCLDCHRQGGMRVQAPILEGQQAAYLRTQLAKFQDRHRDSFPMSSIVAGMDAADLERIATALSQRPWPAPSGSRADDPSTPDKDLPGKRDCAICHGPDLTGAHGIPRLAGQNAGYLRRQLAAFARGERLHPDTGNDIGQWSTTEQADVAAWLATRKPATDP